LLLLLLLLLWLMLGIVEQMRRHIANLVGQHVLLHITLRII
jgi:hypothetical protein